MTPISKLTNSPILQKNLRYKKGDNSELRNYLLAEQEQYCAYTEKYVRETDAADIDHFDPTLKGTQNDSYQNWFVVITWLNRKKSDKWLNYQPLLHPSDSQVATRIFYKDGMYQTLPNDIQARNLRDFLDLNNADLSSERKKYFARMRTLLDFGEEYFRRYFANHPEDYQFRSAFHSETGIIL